jgi:hypothetical protein
VISTLPRLSGAAIESAKSPVTLGDERTSAAVLGHLERGEIGNFGFDGVRGLGARRDIPAEPKGARLADRQAAFTRQSDPLARQLTCHRVLPRV